MLNPKLCCGPVPGWLTIASGVYVLCALVIRQKVRRAGRLKRDILYDYRVAARRVDFKFDTAGNSSAPLLDCQLCLRFRARLRGNKLGDLGCNIQHCVLCGIQSIARSEQRADFSQGVICSAMHNGH